MIRIAAALVLALAAVPAQAADRRMASYDSVSPDARRLTGAGLTFVFSKSWMRTRVLAVRATAVAVGATVRPSGDGALNRKLDALMGEDARHGTLYEIEPGEEQGQIMIQAFCPGSKAGWLAIGPIAHNRPIRVHAFGDDPAGGEPRLCGVMDFSYRGEWRAPRYNTADPTRDVFQPSWSR